MTLPEVQQHGLVKSFPDSVALFFHTGGALLLVIMIFVLAIWLLRRVGMLRVSAQKPLNLHIRYSQALGARTRLVVVDAGNKRLLLGVTADNISCLMLSEPQDWNEGSTSAAVLPGSFQHALLDNLKRRVRINVK